MIALSEDIQTKLADHSWRLNNLYSITTKKAELATLKENNIQRILSNNRHIKRKKILKARQQGVSTHQIIDMFDYTIFHRNVNSLIIADCDDNIKKLFRIVQIAHRNLHSELRPRLDRGGGSKYEYYFPSINSRIACALRSRGETVHRLHISESAFNQDVDGRINSSIETVPSDGYITHETTANGIGNWFYDFWHEDNGYKQFFFPWYFHEEYYDELYEDETIDKTDEEMQLYNHVKRVYGFELTDGQIKFRRRKKKGNKLFIQEYAEDDESCFITSGKRVIDSELLRQLESKAKPPISNIDKWYKQFDAYDKGRNYVIGADVAEGLGGDYSVGVVLQVRPMKLVAAIRSNKWRPREFAEKLIWLAKEYRMAGRIWPLMGVELNNHGHAVVQKLEDNTYPHLYEYAKGKPGWKTTTVTRPKMIDAFVDTLESEICDIHYKELFKECLTLVDNDGKVEAAPGKHDDIVIATSIALQMAIEMDDLTNYVNLKDKIRI